MFSFSASGVYIHGKMKTRSLKNKLSKVQVVNHIERTRKLFNEDVERRRDTINRFEQKYGIVIRRSSDSLEDALERMGVKRETK